MEMPFDLPFIPNSLTKGSIFVFVLDQFKKVPNSCQKMFIIYFPSSDILSEATFFGRPSIPSTDLEHFDFEALLRVIGIESAVEKEPKLRELLDRVNWPKLCRFLVQFYEPERRCRFFECQPYSVNSFK